jgi:hypothetical protein
VKKGQGKAAPWRGRKRVEISRKRFVSVRCLPEEYAKIEAAAEKAGLAIGPYVRAAAIGSRGPRAKRRPRVETRALAQALGLLGRLGSNVNQLARIANTRGDLPAKNELAGIMREVRAMRDALMEALDRDH